MSKYRCEECGKETDNRIIISGTNIEISHCDECLQKMHDKFIWRNEKFRKETITCPWCGGEYDQWQSAMVDSEEHEIYCEICGNQFEVEIEEIRYYTTRKPENLYEKESVQNAEAKSGRKRI